MDDLTRESGACPSCGKPLTAGMPEGLCAACLLAAGAGSVVSLTADLPTLSSQDAATEFLVDGAPRLADGAAWGLYRVSRLLGRGGMGEVYEAEHSETGRRLALKLLRTRLRHGEDRARFLREGQLAASISHPHTVYVFGSEEIAGTPAITMELLPGGTLKDLVADRGPLPAGEAVSAMLDVIGGLDAAQAAGILHRDIKPSNCFVDADGSVKIGDFGLSISTLARDVRLELATSGFQGTPQFAPPEQLRGEPLDVRADIYAVGATLYYLLTGQPPFDAPDLRTLVDRVTTEPARSPRAIRRDIPAGLASIVVDCLAKRAQQRPASYAVLAEHLRPFSRADQAPARPGPRVLAGLLDGAIIALPSALFGVFIANPLTQSPESLGVLAAWSWVVSFAYYALFEGLRNASPGKLLLGLRVVSETGTRPSFSRMLGRASLFHLPHLTVASAISIVLFAGIPSALSVDTGLQFTRWAGTLLLAAVLFSTVRRHNGWTAVHDLVSGTRVVSRAIRSHRLGATAVGPAAAPPTEGPVRRMGPFLAGAMLDEHGGESTLAAFDPVLRRRVWIQTVPAGTPAVGAARRDVSRPGRLHWLTGRRSATENWDAFEAPEGHLLTGVDGGRIDWPSLKTLLVDLASELTAAENDETLPPLSLDRIWIRPDGRLVLLDLPAPGGSANRTDSEQLSPVTLLSALATRASAGNVPIPPSAMPLSARALLTRLTTRTAGTLAETQAALAHAAAAPDRVRRWRRAVPAALAALPLAMMLIASAVAIPALRSIMNPATGDALEWLTRLRQADQSQGEFTEPSMRDAAEIYLAGRHRALLLDEGFWNSTVMRQFADLRAIASHVLQRHPSVSDQEMARASKILAPQLERRAARMAEQRDGFADAAAMIVSTLMSGALALALLFSLLSAALVPGGVITRNLGLAVIDHRGAEIGRWRSVARTAIAWTPAIAWLAYLTTVPRIQVWVPAPPQPLLGAALAVVALAAGAIWMIATPARGLHDRVGGTWVVPR